MAQYSEIGRGLRQKCVMSCWVFNGVFIQVNKRATVGGVKLGGENEGESKIKQVLYADDTMLVIELSNL